MENKKKLRGYGLQLLTAFWHDMLGLSRQAAPPPLLKAPCGPEPTRVRGSEGREITCQQAPQLGCSSRTEWETGDALSVSGGAITKREDRKLKHAVSQMVVGGELKGRKKGCSALR